MWVRVLPYAVLGVLTLIVLVTGAYAWDYTNSPAFCGTTCHTMPPEYAAYSVSPHARVDCVECHIGKGFIATRITRKAGDINHIIAMTFATYEYPIYATKMRPSRETCELCHFPEKFSDDSFREIKLNSYIPTWQEFALGTGIISYWLLGFSLAARFLPFSTQHAGDKHTPA
jgi:nitrate/TMAO reductase-like tetraheme cytochrome c subunit